MRPSGRRGSGDAPKGVGWLGIAHFWAPARADLGLEATKQWFSETYRWETLIGCSIFYVAAGLLTPGSIAFGLMLSRIEGRYPLFSISRWRPPVWSS